jgi:hypothetical protein
MDMFTAALAFLIVACSIVHYYTRQVQQQSKDANYRGFQQTYLIVYLLAASKRIELRTLTNEEDNLTCDFVRSG